MEWHQTSLHLTKVCCDFYTGVVVLDKKHSDIPFFRWPWSQRNLWFYSTSKFSLTISLIVWYGGRGVNIYLARQNSWSSSNYIPFLIKRQPFTPSTPKNYSLVHGLDHHRLRSPWELTTERISRWGCMLDTSTSSTSSSNVICTKTWPSARETIWWWLGAFLLGSCIHYSQSTLAQC